MSAANRPARGVRRRPVTRPRLESARPACGTELAANHCHGPDHSTGPRLSLSIAGAPISDLDFETTEQADLRGGRSVWFAGTGNAECPPLRDDTRCDVLIIGCGITGTLMAERLTRQGLDVVMIDREIPGHGSTAASTSMLLWEIDRPLVELTDLYGFDRAKRAYRASLRAVQELTALVQRLALPCELREKPSLYLAAGSADNLEAEHALRQRADLPGALIDRTVLQDRFGIARAGAIVSPGAADSDPLQLALSLLKVAISRGARLYAAESASFDSASRTVGVTLADGRLIEAQHVVLATGYVMPDIVHAKVHKPSSSWAIATAPQPERLWPDGALIWEDRKDYLYARTTASGRIIIGGEDSDAVIEPEARDALIPAKSRALTDKLAALWPAARLNIDYRWAGTFDTTSDGLPLIGDVPGHPRIHAAYGYGGNGITFSFLAAQLIGDAIQGQRSVLLDDFAIDRDEP